MKIRPNISLIIPIYKVEKYLHTCLNSVLAQNYDNWEVLCVDDASPDNCGMICDSYAQEDSRIKVIHFSKNQGIVIARKRGIEKSSGKYIMFLDGDDFLEPNAFKIMMSEESKDEADIIEGACNIVYEEEYTEDMKKCIESFFNRPVCCLKGDMLHFCFVEKKFTPCLWLKCFKGEILRDTVKCYKEIYCNSMEDSYAFFFIALSTKTFRRINNRFLNYRCGIGISSKKHWEYEEFEQVFNDHNRMLKALNEYIMNNVDKKNPNIYNIIFEDVLREQIDRLSKIHDVEGFLLGLNLIINKWGAKKVAQGLDDLHAMPFPEFIKLQQNIKKLQIILEKKNIEVQSIRDSYEAINNSISFHIGRGITYLPRKIRDL